MFLIEDIDSLCNLNQNLCMEIRTSEFENETEAEILPKNFADLKGLEGANILEKASSKLKITRVESEYRDRVVETLRAASAWIKRKKAELSRSTIKSILGMSLVAELLSACSPKQNLPFFIVENNSKPTTTETTPNNEQAVNIEWEKNNDKVIKRYFELSDNPLQEWESVAATNGGAYLYTFHEAAEILNNDGNIIIKVSKPFPEDYRFYQNTYLSKSWLENDIGLFFDTNLNEAYLKNAIYYFQDSAKVEILITNLAQVPQDVFPNKNTIPRYLDTNRVGVQFIRAITPGPLRPYNATGIIENDKPISNISVSSDFWKPEDYYVRVTSKSGDITIYKLTIQGQSY